MNLIELTGPDSFQRREAPAPPPPGRGEAHVRMCAASLNFIDLAVAQGLYPGTTYPLIPIADGAGEIIAIGPEVTSVAVGDRVALHPKSLWIAGRASALQARTMRGVNRPGSLAEIVAVDAATLVKGADHLSWEEMASLPICATTAWNALATADVGPGSTVALLGTGGVSIFALQLAKARGARVIITSSSDDKLARARAAGADEVVNYRRSQDWDAKVVALTDGVGADLVLDTVGAATFSQSLAAVRQGGVVYTVGFVTGSKVELDLMPLIVKAVRVIGNNTGSVENLSEAAAAIAAHRIQPVIDQVFGLAELPEAYAALAAGGHFGKLAIRLDW
jgi:NADPH:quinone reductase-like Zn-dependent oxidoreductase